MAGAAEEMAGGDDDEGFFEEPEEAAALSSSISGPWAKSPSGPWAKRRPGPPAKKKPRVAVPEPVRGPVLHIATLSLGLRFIGSGLTEAWQLGRREQSSPCY